MKKFIYFILIIGGVIMFSACSPVNNGVNIPGESVYATKTEQEYIYEIMLKSDKFINILEYDGVRVVKDSITPVYIADILEYAKTGDFVIQPMVVDSLGRSIDAPEDSPSNYYIVKTITNNGSYAGDVYFYVVDGIATWSNFSGSKDYYNSEHFKKNNPNYEHTGNYEYISRNYKDHASRIQKLLGKDSSISPSNVRYVSVNQLGGAFYIHDGNTKALIMLSHAIGIPGDNFKEIIYVGDELKKIADDRLAAYNKQVEEMEEWMAKNPGQTYDIVGGAY